MFRRPTMGRSSPVPGYWNMPTVLFIDNCAKHTIYGGLEWTAAHIDSTVQGGRSVSRKADGPRRRARRATHPGGTVTYRDLA